MIDRSADANVNPARSLTCTSTTTYDQPYSLARRFASLDLVSGGRAGWNLVTSGNVSEADSFGPVCGRSLAMRKIFGVLERVAGAEATILYESEDLKARAREISGGGVTGHWMSAPGTPASVRG